MIATATRVGVFLGWALLLITGHWLLAVVLAPVALLVCWLAGKHKARGGQVI